MPYAGKSSDVTGSYRTNAFTPGQGQAAFYDQTGQYTIPVDADPFAQQVFDNSPLQRLILAGMDGTGFQPVSGQHYKAINYRPNSSTTDGNIMQWNTDGSYTTGTYYAANSLQVVDARDEENKIVRTFTDYAGRVVLKRVASGAYYDTYYIYNNAGLLSYVVPPLAVNLLGGTNGYNLNGTPFSNLVYKYIYDRHGHLIQRTIPGKGVMYIVYDSLNRPVLMQDANMRVNNQWNYIKYDAKGRPVIQGIYTDNNNTTLSAMQSYVYGLSYTTWYESRSTTLTNGGYYTNAFFPTGTVSGTSVTPLAYAYFDDYNIAGSPATFAYVPQHDVSLPNEESVTNAMVKGMPTVVMKTTVGSGIASNTWLTTAIFYDHNLHVIQQQSNNQLNYVNATTVSDFKTIVNDFTGMPLNSKVKKARTSTDTVSVYTGITYDQVYRVTQVNQKYNTGANNPVAAYSYNELGQPVLKHLGYVSSTTWLQNVDYRYNIRGWLMSINNSKLTPDGGKTNSDNNDVFGMQLMYDLPDSALSGRQALMYNGTPSGIKWMTRNFNNTRTQERSYLYTYDGLNRYTAGGYAERDSTSTGTSAYSLNRGAFNEYAGYDAGGNITKLARYSTNAAGGQYQIDTLTYGYSTTNPNLLQSVTDGTDSVHTNHGFRNLTDSTGNYTYDANGNLYNDHYKGLELRYDVLNRTDKVTVTTGANKYTNYTYDGAGILIRKQATNGSAVTTTDYIDGFVYITINTGTPALSYFPMPEGRVIDSSGVFKQEFVITDPQGNARVAFRNVDNVAKVWQENSYYGTGFILPNSPVSTPTVPNKQLYNGGSEWQNDYSNLPDYYQTGNRNYDAAVGRFVGVDPQAESAGALSSYQYAGGNPIIYNDPSGGRFGPPVYAVPGQNEFNQIEAQYDQEDQDFSNFFGVGWNDEFLGDAQDISNEYIGQGAINSVRESAGPLTSTGTYDVATSSLLDQAREGATVIGGETMYGGQNVAADAPPGTIDIPQSPGGPNVFDFSGNQLQEVVINGGPANNPFQVLYYPTYYTGDNGQLRYGAFLSLFYKGPISSSYQFIQTVNQLPRHRTPGGAVLTNPFVDTKFNGDNPVNYPFYYTYDNNIENMQYANGLGDAAYFWDLAGSSGPWTVFSAQVTMVTNIGGKLYSGGSISWQYFEVNIPGIFSGSVIMPYIYSPTPNEATQQVINTYNSSH